MRRAWREKREAIARRLLYKQGLTWMEALGRTDLQLQCGARTKAGTPCKRKGIGRGGRCVKHGGASTGPRTSAGREVARQKLAAFNRTPQAAATRRRMVATQPRIRGRFVKLDQPEE